MSYITLTIVAIISFFIGCLSKSNKTNQTSQMSEFDMDQMREDAYEALAQRTKERKERILEMINNANKKAKENQDPNCEVPHIKREDVERLLDVSQQTAHKYLNELESENKIKQVGSTGSSVYYI